jgi:hypothetical protein
MAIALDHFIVPSRDKNAAAKQLAGLLGVPFEEAGAGPFAAVYVNDSLTLDFADQGRGADRHHYCFRVSDEEFDAIFQRIRAANFPYRSTPMGPVDGKINTRMGGKNVYWDQPEGHVWEILTRSYARRRTPA